MGMFEDMKRRLNCAIGEYRIINYCGMLILGKCFRISWDGLEWCYSFELGDDSKRTITLSQTEFHAYTYVDMEAAFKSMEGE